MPTSLPQDRDLPPVAALKALRRKFERECHREFGDSVLSILPDLLKLNRGGDIEALALCAVRNMVATTHWLESEEIGDFELPNPPSPFSAIFARLVKIGRKYEKSLKQNGIDWAVSKMRGFSDMVKTWAREEIGPFTSATMRESFADQFVCKWEEYIEQVADDARVHIAEHSPAPVIEAKPVQRPTLKTPPPEVHADDKEAKSWDGIIAKKDVPDAWCHIANVAAHYRVTEKTIRTWIRVRDLRKHPTPGLVYVRTAIQLGEPYKKRKRRARASRKAGGTH